MVMEVMYLTLQVMKVAKKENNNGQLINESDKIHVSIVGIEAYRIKRVLTVGEIWKHWKVNKFDGTTALL